MVGYRDKRYRDFGWAAARLDDLANYIPARITGLLIVISVFILRTLRRILHRPPGPDCLDGPNAFRIMIRDGRKHLSPNSGIPEAAMAGGLRIRLGGPSIYGGMVVDKPYIHWEGLMETDAYLKASKESIVITWLTSLLGLAGAVALLSVRGLL